MRAGSREYHFESPECRVEICRKSCKITRPDGTAASEYTFGDFSAPSFPVLQTGCDIKKFKPSQVTTNELSDYTTRHVNDLLHEI